MAHGSKSTGTRSDKSHKKKRISSATEAQTTVVRRSMATTRSSAKAISNSVPRMVSDSLRNKKKHKKKVSTTQPEPNAKGSQPLKRTFVPEKFKLHTSKKRRLETNAVRRSTRHKDDECFVHESDDSEEYDSEEENSETDNDQNRRRRPNVVMRRSRYEDDGLVMHESESDSEEEDEEDDEFVMHESPEDEDDYDMGDGAAADPVGEDVGDELNNLTLNDQDEGTTGSSTTRKSRGPNQCKKVYDRDTTKKIIFNASGQPIGPRENVGELSRFLGTLARKGIYAPISLERSE